MTLSLKYQPYHGYSCHPWLWYGLERNDRCPRRIRTRGDYRYNVARWDDLRNRPQRYWQRPSSNGGSVYEKQRVHRAFRREAKRLIKREIAGDDDVAHRFCANGDYLD